MRIPYPIMIEYVDIGAVINSLGIKVARVTGKKIVCHCIMPDHSDSTPSMHIDRVTGVYFCFGCRAKGDLKDLVTVIKGLEFPENKDYLMQFTNLHDKSVLDIIDDIDSESGIGVKQSDIIVNGSRRSSPYIQQDVNDKPVYYPIGTEFWSAEVYEWCEKSHVDYNYIKRYFNIGFCRIGKYHDRIIIPVWFKGKLANFQARDYTGESENKDLYIYGIPVAGMLFNYDNIRMDYPVVVTEGSVDVLRLWPYSTNCVSVFGNYLCDAQAELLKSASSLVILPDNDKGGQVLLKSIKEKLSDKIMWLRFFDKKDIPNLIKKAVKINGK